MEWIYDNRILIVGLGLMGGSYAKALKKIGYYVTAIDVDPDSIEYAIGNSIIDEGAAHPDPELISRADTVIFAVYPHVFKSWIEENQKYFKSGIYITDVTGVKESVVYDIQSVLRSDVEFIASHPMAGREVYGVKNSTDEIFRDANYIVVPTSSNTLEAVEWCKKLGRILGFARISVLSPEEHDEMIGFLSQLAHCIAISLMTCSDNHHLVDYTGDSFRDLTRIANINEEMWSELFFLNKDRLIGSIDMFQKELSEVRDLLANGNLEGLKDKMKLSTLRRSWFDKDE